jgi:exopolysaccharide biosynthesis polyprenyl glycosylphosphotransferase
MSRHSSVNKAVLSMLIDIILISAALGLAALIRYNWPEDWPSIFITPIRYLQFPFWSYLAALFIWSVVFLLSSVYDPSRNVKLIDEFQRVILANTGAAIAFAGVMYIFASNVSRALYLLFIILSYLFLVGWRLLGHMFFPDNLALRERKNILVVGANELGKRVALVVKKQSQESRLHLIGYLDDQPIAPPNGLPVLGTLDDVREVIATRQIDDVVIALPLRSYDQVNKVVRDVVDMPVHVHVIPDYFELALYRTNVENFGGLPVISLRDPALNEVQRFLKRLFDIVVIVFLIAFALPFMLIFAILIKLDSAGPVLFKQDRVGENGRIFKMYKFRSMVQNAEQLQSQVLEETGDGHVVHKKAEDARVTRFGRFLRRSSMDELPNFFNILKGDMSLVGPRPEMPWLVDEYAPWQRIRFAVPQGLTGWWQVNGRSERVMHLHTEDDLYYIENYSMWLDFYILLKTPLAVLRGKGAF